MGKEEDMQINGYGANYVGTNRTSNSKKNTQVINGQEVQVNDGNELGMDSFLNLLAAQLSNQDMNNPMDNTQFIAQLAQFSTLQAMSSMAKIQDLQQSTSLVGKKVIVADVKSDADKYELIKDTGYVDKVTIFGDEPQIFVNGKAYAFKNVMEILDVPELENVAEGSVLLGRAVTMKVPVENDDENEEEEDENKPIEYDIVRGIVQGVHMNDEGVLQIVVDGVSYDYNYVTKIEEAPKDTSTEDLLNGIYESLNKKVEVPEDRPSDDVVLEDDTRKETKPDVPETGIEDNPE